MSHKGTILIVEDQQGFRRIYHDVLANEGYAVLEAEDGEAGWNAVKREKPQLVLLDLGLPLLDGFEVLKRIRGDADTKNIPVIIFSVLGEQKDVKKGLELGANDYMVKGFYTPRQILSKIKSLTAGNEQQGTTGSYKLAIDPAREDAANLQKEVGLGANYQCPQCRQELVLELFPDVVRGNGHWFSAHFMCRNCGKTV